MVPLFALSLRRSEEFTNALVARGYAFTGQASKVKRADYILTHYSFKNYDLGFTILVGLLFVALLFFRYGSDIFSIEASWIINWLYTLVT
jgi:energy-coupling factor transporter transmembrane protein EcfT